MTTLLSGLSMSLGTAFVYYFIRIIMFAAVAALGISLGYKYRNKKSADSSKADSKED